MCVCVSTHVKAGSDPQRGEKENSVQIDFINLDQTSKSDAKHFILIFKHDIIWKKATSVTHSLVPKETIITSFLPIKWVLSIGDL